MRRLLASMSMALAVSAAGAASAHDATRVIYDLSSLQRHPVVARAPSGSSNFKLPTGNLPLMTPSAPANRGDASPILTGGDDLEVLNPKHGGGPIGSRIVTSPGGGKGSGSDRSSSLPNPEPGTMLLLGSGVLAGARYLRRRSRP